MCVCVHNRIDNCSSCSYSYRRLFCSHKPPACVRLRSVAMKELTLWRALSLAPPTNSASFAYCAFGGKAVLGCLCCRSPAHAPGSSGGKLQRAKKKKKKLQTECGRQRAPIRPRPSYVSHGDWIVRSRPSTTVPKKPANTRSAWREGEKHTPHIQLGYN